MTLNEYQEKAMQTCMPSCDNMAYMLINLMSEVGELAGKISKPLRKEKAIFRNNFLTPMHLLDEDDLFDFEDMRQEIILEAGDILWQLSGVLKVLDVTLEEAGIKNIEKLASRAKRGKIDGDGDHR